jgi:hypothetical protein
MWKLWNRLFGRNKPAALTARTNALPHDLRAVSEGVSQGWVKAQAIQAERARLVRLIADHPDQALAHLTHQDGYVREAALRHVLVADASSALALLLLERCNDCVPQLRKLAMARLCDVVALLPETDLFPLVRSILGRATSWQRWGSDMGGLANLFDKPAMRNAVNAYLMTASHGPVVRQARWAMRLGIVDAALADLSLSARSNALRAVATECLLDSKVYWTESREKVWIDKPMGLFRNQPRWQVRELGAVSYDRVALLHAGARDKSPAVRRVVAEHLCKTGPELALAAAIATLLEDKSPTVVHRMLYFRQKWPMKTA